MESSKKHQLKKPLPKNNTLHIDIEAVATLSMASMGILSPITGLMNEKIATNVDLNGEHQGQHYPFSFILAPSGKRNAEVLRSAKVGDTLLLVCCGEIRGELVVDDLFEIDPEQRVKRIFSTDDMNHPGVVRTLERLGSMAVCGKYSIDFPDVKETKEIIKRKISSLEAKKISGIVMAARPLHRGHERVIRTALDDSDLLVIFLTKPYLEDYMDYELRKEIMDFFVNNYLPRQKVLVVPLENTYIFAGQNEIILNSIVVKNYGCTRFVVGQTHAGLGLHYKKKQASTIFDELKDVGIDITTVSEFVYCDTCKTIVTTNTCPHGQHHHISYHSDAIIELFKTGILPPAVLIRTEISAIILAKLYPNRFENISKLYYDFMPSSGLIESHSEKDFYLSLMQLYQTTSLT
jgi:sulfate adenylyltransferase